MVVAHKSHINTHRGKLGDQQTPAHAASKQANVDQAMGCVQLAARPSPAYQQLRSGFCSAADPPGSGAPAGPEASERGGVPQLL